MKYIRIIPRLDIKGPNLIKGIHLEGLRTLGKPEDFAYKYYLDGADELIYMDVVASLFGRNSLLDIVKRTAEKMFIPLTVGGGIRTIDDMRNILRAGADKIAINTAAIKKPQIITEGARTFGSQCIVVSIEAKYKGNDKYEAYTDNGRETTGVDVYEWAKRSYELGAGELLITSIDREGTRKGFDTHFVRKISESVPIPVIACGGAGSMEDFCKVITEGGADAVSAASVFHYRHLPDRLDPKRYKREEGEIEYLKHRMKNGSGEAEEKKSFLISDLKLYLNKNSIPVRMADIKKEKEAALGFCK